MLTTKENNSDKIYISGIKPISVIQADPATNKCTEINLMDYFPQAWRTYYPRLYLLPSGQANQVILYEEATNEYFKVDFENNQLYKMGKSFLNGNLALKLVKSAKRTLTRFYSDLKHSNKTVALESPHKNTTLFVNYQTHKSLISFMNIEQNMEVNLSLESMQLGISKIKQVSENTVLISAFDLKKVTVLENLAAEEIQYYFLHYPLEWDKMSDSDDVLDMFRMEAVDGNLMGYKADLLLDQGQLKNLKSANGEQATEATSTTFKVILYLH